MDEDGVSIDSLKQQVERLRNELDQTANESAQSAQYGLVLLEEKLQLQTRCEELETLFETTKHELDLTREVSGIAHVIAIIIACNLFLFNLTLLGPSKVSNMP